MWCKYGMNENGVIRLPDCRRVFLFADGKVAIVVNDINIYCILMNLTNLEYTQ